MKYTPNTATAVEENAMRIWFIRKVITEPMDCITTDGMPIARMRLSVAPCGRKPFMLMETSGFLRMFITRPIAAATHWPRMVA